MTDKKASRRFLDSLRTAADAEGDLGLADLIDSSCKRTRKTAKVTEQVHVQALGGDRFQVEVEGRRYSGRVTEVMLQLEDAGVVQELLETIATRLVEAGADVDELHGVGYGALVIK